MRLLKDRRFKLTDDEVRWVRRIYRPGMPGRSMRALAITLDCSVQHISDIIHGRRRVLEEKP